MYLHLDKKMKNRLQMIEDAIVEEENEEEVEEVDDCDDICGDDTEKVNDSDTDDTSYYCDDLPTDTYTGSSVTNKDGKDGSHTAENDAVENDEDINDDSSNSTRNIDIVSPGRMKYHKPSKVHFTEKLLKDFLKGHSTDKPLKVILFSRYSGSFKLLKNHFKSNSNLRKYKFYAISGENSPRYKICLHRFNVWLGPVK
jgi:hypothetical protein